MLRRETSPPTEAVWCSCSIEGSWAEESSKGNWQLSMIIIRKMSQSELPSWVWKENTVWNCLDQIPWLFLHWNKSRGRDLGKLILNVLSWFCFPLFKGVTVLFCSIISAQLKTGHPHPQPAEHGVISCPLSGVVSSFCSRAVWHEIEQVDEEQNAISRVKETQPTFSF